MTSYAMHIADARVVIGRGMVVRGIFFERCRILVEVPGHIEEVGQSAKFLREVGVDGCLFVGCTFQTIEASSEVIAGSLFRRLRGK